MCLIRGCVKQYCCGTLPWAAESFTAVSQPLGLWFTTSGVNWRDKPSSIQALTPPCGITAHSRTQCEVPTEPQPSRNPTHKQSVEMMHGNKS